MTEPSKAMTNSHNLIKEEEVKKALQKDKGKDALLKSFNIVDFTDKGDNYACFVTSVEVKYSLNAEEDVDVSYVVKLNPCRNFEGFDDLMNVFFTKESRFYLDIIPELNATLETFGEEPLRFPKCFHVNLEMKNEQIYFQDLRKKDFKMFDRRKGMDEQHVTFVMKELARLHAASYLLQDKTPEEPLEAKYDFLLKDWMTFTDNADEIMGPVLQGHLSNAVDILTKAGYNEKAISWVENLKSRLPDVLNNEMRSEKFDVIGHGDCWNNNILFRYNSDGEPVDVMLLDLQICRRASLAIDLNYFLYTSVTGNVRRPNLETFLSTYHSTYEGILEAGGKDMYFSEQELLKEFRNKNVFGAIFGMMILPILLMESDKIPDLSGDNTDIQETMSQFRSMVINMVDSHPLLKPRFLALFDEFTETGLIS